MSRTEGAPNSSTYFRFVDTSYNMYILFFGGTFLGIELVILGLQFQGWASWIPWLAGWGLLSSAFWRTRGKIPAIVGGIVAFIMVYVALRALSFLAAGGMPSGYRWYEFLWWDVSNGWYFWVQIYLAVAILWLMIGVPRRAFWYQLDSDGKGEAQRTLVGLLAAAASIMSGIFIVTLHFGGGVLYPVNIGLLVAGSIFTVFLVLPAYRSVAKTVWRRGLRGLFYPESFMKRWGKIFTELHAALDARDEMFIAWMALRDPEILAQYPKIEARFPGFGARWPEIADLYREGGLPEAKPIDRLLQVARETGRAARPNKRTLEAVAAVLLPQERVLGVCQLWLSASFDCSFTVTDQNVYFGKNNANYVIGYRKGNKHWSKLRESIPAPFHINERVLRIPLGAVGGCEITNDVFTLCLRDEPAITFKVFPMKARVEATNTWIQRFLKAAREIEVQRSIESEKAIRGRDRTKSIQGSAPGSTRRSVSGSGLNRYSDLPKRRDLKHVDLKRVQRRQKKPQR
jgi:hypothetical protein